MIFSLKPAFNSDPAVWRAVGPGIPMEELSIRFEMTFSAVNYAVKRGRKGANEGRILICTINLFDHFRGVVSCPAAAFS